MSSLNQGDHEDIMRAFFRNHVGNIDKLLRIIPEIAKHAAEQSGRELEVLSEANRVILVRAKFLQFHFSTSVLMVCRRSLAEHSNIANTIRESTGSNFR